MTKGKKTIIAVTVLFASLILTGCGNPVADFNQAVRSGNLEQAEALLAEEPTLVDAEEGGRTLLFLSLIHISEPTRPY